ncbi:DNA-directed RNA polymerase, mitochondrial [Manis javanica]|nr:DNA-directed RNA polymerase, mitochondrial [Manis javanica]
MSALRWGHGAAGSGQALWPFARHGPQARKEPFVLDPTPQSWQHGPWVATGAAEGAPPPALVSRSKTVGRTGAMQSCWRRLLQKSWLRVLHGERRWSCPGPAVLTQLLYSAWDEAGHKASTIRSSGGPCGGCARSGRRPLCQALQEARANEAHAAYECRPSVCPFLCLLTDKRAGASAVLRLAFADERMDDILDAADRPMTVEVFRAGCQPGLQVAQVLEGFISRKVVKQTVMTVVRGYTRYGGRLQIEAAAGAQRLPQEFVWEASHYLVRQVFHSLQEMFSGTRAIQRWLTESARLIASGSAVEWITPGHPHHPALSPGHPGTSKLAGAGKDPVQGAERDELFVKHIKKNGGYGRRTG